MKNILITGSEGFVGKNLINYFKNSSYNIIHSTLKEVNLASSTAVQKLFVNNSIDCIIHCATGQQINKSYDPNVCKENLAMYYNLIKFKKNNTKLISLGSGSEYSSRDHWVSKMDEDYFGKFIPTDDHSFSKYVISKYIIDSKRNDLYHLRIFGIFGKYEDYNFKFISNTIVKKIFNIPIIINQNAIYDYLFVDDFCKIVDFFIKHETDEKIFNVTPNKSIDLISIVKIIDKFFDDKSNVTILKTNFGKEYTGNSMRLHKAMTEKGRELFIFSDLNDSIKKLVEYYFEIKNNIKIDDLKNDRFLEFAKKVNP